MKKLLAFILLFAAPVFLMANEDRPPIGYDFLSLRQTQQFIDKMVHRHHFERSYVTEMLKDAKLDRDTLARYTGRYKAGSTVGTWSRFRAHVLDADTLQKAKNFTKDQHKILTKAANEYAVPPEYIVGFLTVESKLGTYTGDYRILDALATLAFHTNRMQNFFRSELEHYFLMCREQGYDPRTVEGSFAGAMGCVQQMPSVYRHYGMDYNQDGKKDPWSIEDCVGIIARFMHQNGWKNGAQVAVMAKYEGDKHKTLKSNFKRRYTLPALKQLGITPTTAFQESSASFIKLSEPTGDKVWLGAKNLNVITRYNASSNYAMAIHLIAQSVR